MGTQHLLRVSGVSGRFDRAHSLVAKSSQFMRHEEELDVIGRTELARLATSLLDEAGWTTQKIGEYVLETRDSKIRVLEEPYTRTLTTISYKRIAANGGGKTPPFTAGVFLCRTRGEDHKRIAFIVVHAPTIKGRLRILANLAYMRGLAKLSKELQGKGWRVVVIGDLNRNARSKVDAALVTNLVLRPGILVDVWIGALPKFGGTHGALKNGIRPVIDWILTNTIVKSRWFVNDGINDSDHHPYAALLDVSARALRLRKKR